MFTGHICEPPEAIRHIIGTVTVIAGVLVVQRWFNGQRRVVVRVRILAEVVDVGVPAARSILQWVHSALVIVLGGSLVGSAVCWMTAAIR